MAWGSSGASRDFVGIDAAQINDELIPAIQKTIDSMKEQLDRINVAASARKAFAGESINEALQTYLETCKAAINDFIATMETEKTWALKAVEEFKSGDSSIGGEVSQSGQDVRALVNNIRLD